MNRHRLRVADKGSRHDRSKRQDAHFMARNSPCNEKTAGGVMCKHILNVQVAFRAPCCKRWFDCTECHFEMADHAIVHAPEMAFACKQCKKCFRKILSNFTKEDEYCPHCNNHYVIKAELPPRTL